MVAFPLSGIFSTKGFIAAATSSSLRPTYRQYTCSLKAARLVAGHQGLDSIVTTISVIEFDDYEDDFYVPNEIVITSFYSVKDDIGEQCRILEHSKNSGDVAVVLFYSDLQLISSNH